MTKQANGGIYYFLGNITSHIPHALPLHKELGGTFVVTSKQAAKRIQKYNLPVLYINDRPYKWTWPGKRPKRIHEYITLDKKLKHTYDFLNTHASIIVFYELFDLQHPEWLDKPKKIFLPHGNMLKSYMTMHPQRLDILRHYDYMAALSPYMRDRFIKDGVPANKLVDLGIARVDDLLRDNKDRANFRISLAAKFQFDPNKKIILYTPTFWGSSSVYTTGLEIIKYISDEYTFLFRPHPQTPKKIRQKYDTIIKNRQNVFYADDAPLTQLLVSSDIFIGDVSSVVLEMILLDTPIIFAHDISKHQQSDDDYTSIKEIVESSPQVTFKNASTINKIVSQALKKGIQKNIWTTVRKRTWFPQSSQTKEIRDFIRSLL